MKPKKSFQHNPQPDLFQPELRNLINPSHSLVKLSGVVDWEHLDQTFGETFSLRRGRPAISTRLMIALHYFKYTFDLSDEDVLLGWTENPYWQYFSGMKYFEHKLPINPSSMTRWRKRIGKAGAEELLKQTIEANLQSSFKTTGVRAKSLCSRSTDGKSQELHKEIENLPWPSNSRHRAKVSCLLILSYQHC